MKSIFKDGYLKSEFINPNYRGLVGWPCQDGDLIKGIDDGFAWFGGSNFYTTEPMENVAIPQFTKFDIPVGELCWFKVHSQWTLLRYGNSIITMSTHYVPYIIAETTERLEELKDWWKR